MEDRMATQCENLRALFTGEINKWIPLPRILSMGIAQYNARIFELRRQGMDIENKTERVNGRRHSFFRYNKPISCTISIFSLK